MENHSISIPFQTRREMTNSLQLATREAWLKEGRMAWADYQKTGLHLDNKEVLDWMDKIIAGEKAPMPNCHI